MFKSLEIKNLRSITELKIENLGQVNLFVGHNNCGKTTVLESLFFLIGPTNPHLPVRANSFRGLTLLGKEIWPTFFHNMDVRKTIHIMGITKEENKRHSLEIDIRKKDVHNIPQEETVHSDLVRGTGDSEMPFIAEGLTFHFTLNDGGKTQTSSIFLNGEGIKTEGIDKPVFRGIFISPAVESEFKDRFDDIQSKKQTGEVISLLREVDPKIVDLRLNRAGILMADIGLPELIPVNLMGGGIVRFLSIALAMLSYKGGIVMIDEIENGIHHSLQETLWKTIFSWANKLNVQVFATTHSYENINAFDKSSRNSLFAEEAKVFRIERKDNTFKSIEFDVEKLERFLEKMWEVR
ncbi:MAG TPA: AAA family ATPase [Flexilinea sp.]|nr:AAA family ATPase [Flexilinea sp.]